MQTTFKRVFVSCALLSLFSTFLAPLVAEAKVKKKKIHRYRMSISSVSGRDEKNFDNPTSRCLTKEMIALNQRILKQMEKDIETPGASEQAIASYKEKLDIVWSAMNEPYCGYGSRGIAAVKKSFLKSVERVRKDFLEELKKELH